jgi:hypothetical protein
MARRFSLVLVTAAVFSPAISGAQTTVDEIRARIDNRLRDYAQGALTVLGFSVVPSETASTLAIDSGEPGDFGFVAGQFGGAFTVGDSFPLYLEGFLGYSRYDPDFVFNATGDDLSLPGKWTGFSATGGVGWDFPLTDRLTLRPMANIALGHVESDVSVIGRIIESETGLPTGDFEDGRVSAYGYGGSVMLDFEDYTPEREIDVELRYTHIRLESFDASVERLETSSDAVTLGLWSRLRVPTGLTLFSEPLRAVGETAFGWYLGDQKVVLDSPWLGQVGAGLEIDFAQVGIVPISRGRLVGRYVFGDGVQGFSIGLGASF